MGVEFTMRQRAIVSFWVLIMAVGYVAVSWGIPSADLGEGMAQTSDFVCVSDGAATGMLADMMFAAATNSKANKCLEDCSRTRQQCEQRDKHRPGSKENVEWSRQCQGNYSQCMNGCK